MHQEHPVPPQAHEEPHGSLPTYDSQPSTALRSATVERHGSKGSHSINLEARRLVLSPPSNLGSTSSSEVLSPLREYPQGLDPRYSSKHAVSSTSTNMLNPKRAYRQRRKDPSCDACRERKVKCDATDTTSCTECSSRNVRCQFTKDTNRRMSSIKQVQDLEKQLQDVRHQLERFRASEQYVEQDSPSGLGTFDASPDIADVTRSPRRMLRARAPHDVATLRLQLSDFARGLFKPPVTSLASNDVDRCNQSSVSLPSQESAEHLLSAYFDSVHRRLPVLYWPDFCGKFWSLYAADRVTGLPKETLSISFAVLGLGALFSTDPEVRRSSEHLITTAISYTNIWNEATGIDQCLATFLLSVYFHEVNQKWTAWMLLGSAVQFAQDNGLHTSGGSWTRTTAELRRRIWYCFYVSERLLATEINRPMIINDEDCDTEYPENLPEEESNTNPHHPQRPTLLKATIYVARLLQPLAQLCRSLCIPADALRTFEIHLGTCMQTFPSELRLGSDLPLDPLWMAPLIAFQNTRLVLHRHNISPACSSAQRSSAIENCTLAAEDTATVFSRCFAVQVSVEQLSERLQTAATASVCTHVWRCLLFLAFRQIWGAFHVLVRLGSIVGDHRPINTSCGRYLGHFLDVLIEKSQQGTLANLEENPELIALLSGDLQAGSSGWVWSNKESGVPSSQSPDNASSPESRPSSERLPSWSSLLPLEQSQRWGGWTRISQAAQYLEQLHSNRKPQATVPQGSSYATAEVRVAPQDSGSGQRSSTAKSRMAIASITDQ